MNLNKYFNVNEVTIDEINSLNKLDNCYLHELFEEFVIESKLKSTIFILKCSEIQSGYKNIILNRDWIEIKNKVFQKCIKYSGNILVIDIN